MEQKVEEGSRETDWRREDGLMGNESKYHRLKAHIYSIKCRTGDESGGCSRLEGRRSYKAEGLIGRKSGWVHIQFSVIQRIENADECSDIEKRERSVGPKFQ
jgi:hypothetical protein